MRKRPGCTCGQQMYQGEYGGGGCLLGEAGVVGRLFWG